MKTVLVKHPGGLIEKGYAMESTPAGYFIFRPWNSEIPASWMEPKSILEVLEDNDDETKP